MTATEIDIYINRIEVNDLSLDFQGLRNLQENHLLRIPFENLDVVVRRRVNLDVDLLFHKIIESNRGGYCFELNTLFAALLKSVGFEPKPILGRVWLRNPSKLPPRNHMAHLVTIDDDVFITDVGFGGLTTQIPLNINQTDKIMDSLGYVRVLPIGPDQYMIQRKAGIDWLNQFSFEATEVGREDIEIAHYFMSTNPKSHFVGNAFLGKFTSNGKIGLYNNQWTRRVSTDIVERREIPFGKEWVSVIKSTFGIQLDFTPDEFNLLFNC